MNRTQFYLPIFLACTYLCLPSTTTAQSRFRSGDRLEQRQRFDSRDRDHYKRSPHQNRFHQDQNLRSRKQFHQRSLRSRIWRDGMMTRKEQYLLRQHQLRQFRHNHPRAFEKMSKNRLSDRGRYRI